jgi:peroxiredoxin
MKVALDERFPELCLPDHTGRERTLEELAEAHPLLLCFARGWWCPKEQVRMSKLVAMQEELQREYGRIAVVTVDPPAANGAFRAGLGASFPFLSDERRRVAKQLDLVEETDAKHRPFLPVTFLLDSTLRARRAWVGFWYWENPTPEELRQALREVTRAEQPTHDPQGVWREGGGPRAGIAAPVVWVREDSEGREIQRGVHAGPLPEVGAELGRSAVDGRPWLVQAVERDGDRVALRVRKGGGADPNPLPQHRITAPRPADIG